MPNTTTTHNFVTLQEQRTLNAFGAAIKNLNYLANSTDLDPHNESHQRTIQHAADHLTNLAEAEGATMAEVISKMLPVNNQQHPLIELLDLIAHLKLASLNIDAVEAHELTISYDGVTYHGYDHAALAGPLLEVLVDFLPELNETL